MTDEERVVAMKDQYYQDGIKPQLFKTLIGKGHQDFQTGQQQDAREYFMHFLEKITRAEKAVGASDPGTIYDFELEERLQCTQCKRVKYRTQSERILQLRAPVAGNVEKGTEVNISDCFENFFAEGLIEGVECAGCGTKSNYTRRQRFLTYPKVLCICLQRFVHDDWVPKKLEIELQVPNGDNANVDCEVYRSAGGGKPVEGEELIPE